MRHMWTRRAADERIACDECGDELDSREAWVATCKLTGAELEYCEGCASAANRSQAGELPITT